MSQQWRSHAYMTFILIVYSAVTRSNDDESNKVWQIEIGL